MTVPQLTPVQLIHLWQKALDNPGKVLRILLLDYSKALDYVDHSLHSCVTGNKELTSEMIFRSIVSSVQIIKLNATDAWSDKKLMYVNSDKTKERIDIIKILLCITCLLALGINLPIVIHGPRCFRF